MKREYKKARYKGMTYYYVYIIDEKGKRSKGKKITEEEYFGGHRLVTKKGNLTKYGKQYRQNLERISDEFEREYNLMQFDVYTKIRASKGEATTLKSFKSHLADNKLERMFYNLNTSAEEISEQTGYDVDEVLNAENWDFENNTFKDFQFEYDYDEYYGYKLTRRA